MNRGPQHNLVGQSSVTHLALLAMMITQTFRYANHWSVWVVLAESIMTLGLVFGLPRLLQVWSKRLNTPCASSIVAPVGDGDFPTASTSGHSFFGNRGSE